MQVSSLSTGRLLLDDGEWFGNLSREWAGTRRDGGDAGAGARRQIA